MSVDVSRTTDEAGEAAPGEAVRRPFARFVVHAAGLLMVLLALVVFTDTGHIVNADEGAALSQAEIIGRTGGTDWAMSYPAAEIDPDGVWFPLDLSERVDGRWYPYTKKIAYPVVVGFGLEAGGLAGVLAIHALAVWGTALGAAFLARRLTSVPTADRWVLWTVGIGSAVFFDAFWVIAHAPGALATTVAVLGLVLVVQRRPAIGAVLLGSGILGASLFRTEATLAGLALAGGALIWSAVWRRRDVAVAAALAFIATVAGYFGSAWLDRSVKNVDAVTPFRIRNDEGFAEARMSGFYQSVLRPELGGPGWTTPFVLGAVIGLVVAMAAAISGRTRLAAMAAGTAVVFALVRVVAPVAMLPGLLVATPVLVVSIWLLARRPPRDQASRMVVTAAALFAAAVMATQYAQGGSGDWGGRYFHLMIPAFIAVSAGPWLTATGAGPDGSRAQASGYRWVIGSALIVSLLWAVLAVRTVDHIHHSEQLVVETAAEVAAGTASADDELGPVVVVTSKASGRFAWEHVLDARYLAVTEPADIKVLDKGLVAADVPDLVVVADADGIREFSEGLSSYSEAATHPIDGSDLAVAVFEG